MIAPPAIGASTPHLLSSGRVSPALEQESRNRTRYISWDRSLFFWSRTSSLFLVLSGFRYLCLYSIKLRVSACRYFSVDKGKKIMVFTSKFKLLMFHWSVVIFMICFAFSDANFCVFSLVSYWHVHTFIFQSLFCLAIMNVTTLMSVLSSIYCLQENRRAYLLPCDNWSCLPIFVSGVCVWYVLNNGIYLWV